MSLSDTNLNDPPIHDCNIHGGVQQIVILLTGENIKFYGPNSESSIKLRFKNEETSF